MNRTFRLYKRITGLFILSFLLVIFIPARTQAASDPVEQAVRYGTTLKVDGLPFDLRAASGLLNEEYRVLEGGCVDNSGYAYFVLYNKAEVKCKILKVLLKDKKVVKVSGVLPLDHGNDITYNPKTGKLVIVHCMTASDPLKDISIVDPNTLQVERRMGSKDIVIPDSLAGATAAQLQAIQGFDGISYNAARDEYVVLIKGDSGNMLILNSSFKPVRYIKVSHRYNYVNQGIDCNDKHIIVAQSANKPNNLGNILAIYDWNGRLVRRISLKGIQYEIENIFHVNDIYYFSCFAYNGNLAQVRFALIYTIGSGPAVEKVKLDKEKATVNVGATVKLTTKVTPAKAPLKTVRYFSANSSVASVKGSGTNGLTGTVKALKPGMTRITVYSTEGYHTDSFFLTVRLPYPKMKTAVSIGDGVSIGWTNVSGATNWRIYRKTQKDKHFKKIKTLSGKDKTSFKDTTGKMGTVYTYTVEAFNVSTHSYYAKSTIKQWYCKAPTAVKLTSGKKKATFRWSGTPGAKGFQVRYSTNPEFKKAKAISLSGGDKRSKTIKKLNSGKTYYFKVRGWRKQYGKKWYTPYSDVMTVTTK